MKKLLCLTLATLMLLLSACSSVEPTELPDEIVEESYNEETYEEPIEIDDTDEEYEYEEYESEAEEFVLNTNSYKIHYPWCHSAKRTKDYNKKYVTDTVDNLIDQGYSPCGNCDPS